MRNNKFLSKFVRTPWQIPLFVAITIYGIYKYGIFDFRVIGLFLVTVVFIVLMIVDRRKKK
jgi:hypothetical protein